MNRQGAERLAKRIEREDSRCHVTGMRRYGPSSYALDVVDTRDGGRFAVNSPDDWDGRRDAAAALDGLGE